MEKAEGTEVSIGEEDDDEIDLYNDVGGYEVENEEENELEKDSEEGKDGSREKDGEKTTETTEKKNEQSSANHTGKETTENLHQRSMAQNLHQNGNDVKNSMPNTKLAEDAAGNGSVSEAKVEKGEREYPGGSVLTISDLQWWTTDANLESALSAYGRVKEIKFFEEKASGKSKGFCQVEFFDAAAAKSCKNEMTGKVFNGKSCSIAFTNPQSGKQASTQQQVSGRGGPQGRGKGDVPGQVGNIAQGRGTQMRQGNVGTTVGRGMDSGRGRGVGGRGRMGPVPPFGPLGMMPVGGFEPPFGPMGGRGGFGMGRGGFGPPFSGMGPGMGPGMDVPPFGVAPHINPAFFNRGGMEGPPGGPWGIPPGMWSGEDMGGVEGDGGMRQRGKGGWRNEEGGFTGGEDGDFGGGEDFAKRRRHG